MTVDICAINEGLTHETIGLLDQFGYEISATVDDLALQTDCREFVKFVADYVASGNAVHSGETLKYGYWITKAALDDRRRLMFLEYNQDSTDFIFGVTNTLSYWRDQHQICNKVGAEFFPPRLDQMVVISDGVYEGDDVEGVRYPSPDHMSGWWLTTDRYNGEIETLRTVHAHHVSAKRPDLVKFLALPFGYRFFSPQSDVWFDEKVAGPKS
ncbi:hypothetical protein [Paraherbaspirillum soli]|uniref:Imm33-like domain-containing protein n=1 Tax=Paraherbaspirillum soli TaxID=631222 RepID=A0ABW0MG80_9BURK